MSAHHHLYNRAQWRRLRAAQLCDEPLCRMCRALGRLVLATVADHVKPHRGDEALFFDPTNLQSLCKPCHDGHKQAQEHQADGLLRGAGHDGSPLDLAHPWHHIPRREPISGPQSDRRCEGVRPVGRAPAAPARPMQTSARGMREGQGGYEKSRSIDPNTACVSSFATCHKWEGGV